MFHELFLYVFSEDISINMVTRAGSGERVWEENKSMKYPACYYQRVCLYEIYQQILFEGVFLSNLF